MVTTSIMLVNAGNDPSKSDIANDHVYPALAPLALGTWLQQKVNDVSVSAYDGGIVSMDTIKDAIRKDKPTIVGVSVLATSFANSVELARCAKENGSIVVLGNDHAAQTSQHLLRNHESVDFVIGSEYGEFSLESLVRRIQGESIASIPHLTWREGDQIKGFLYEDNKFDLLQKSLDIFPVTNRHLYSKEHWTGYLSNYLTIFGKLHHDAMTGVTTINMMRGCNRATEKCKPCDMFLNPRYSTPERFWREVVRAHEQVGSTVFYEAAVSFSSSPRFIRRLNEARPLLDFDPKFIVYCQARDVTRSRDLVPLLKDLGVFKVNLGLESGNDEVLKHIKGIDDSVAYNRTALERLKTAGIATYTSFIFGTDPETDLTAKDTVEFVKRCLNDELISDVEAQTILPLPNNYYGKRMLSSGSLSMDEFVPRQGSVDVSGISKRYVDQFSGISYEAALDAVRETRGYAKGKANYGSGVTDKSHID